MTLSQTCLPPIGSALTVRPATRFRASADLGPAAERLLRDVAFVLHATRAVRSSLVESKTASPRI